MQGVERLEAACARHDPDAISQRDQQARDRAIDRGGSQDDPPLRTIRAAGKFPGVATGSAHQATIPNIEIPPPRPPARAPSAARSACEMHRAWIEERVQLGHNAVKHRSRSRRGSRLHASLPLGQALRARTEDLRARTLRCTGELARRRGASGLRARHTHAHREWQVPPPISVRDDAEVFQQILPQGALENRPTKLGAIARRGVPRVRRVSTYVVLDNLKQGEIPPGLYEPQRRWGHRRSTAGLSNVTPKRVLREQQIRREGSRRGSDRGQLRLFSVTQQQDSLWSASCHRGIPLPKILHSIAMFISVINGTEH